MDENKEDTKVSINDMKQSENNNKSEKTQKNKNINNKPKITKSEELFQIQSHNISLQDILGDDDDNEDEKGVNAQFVGNENEVKLTEKEEKELEMFMPRSQREQMTLHDIILKRVTKKEEDNMSTLNATKIIERKIPKKVIAVYIDIANILSKWRSGKLPKAFKIIPQLQDWEEIIYITNPDKWTASIVYQGTKLFASQANQSICQRFYNTILLPRVRDDILMNKKLNFHLYQAVRKALFKPQAFFRGFLLPLCQDECRAREAIILGGIIQKNSIPVIQSALAIYKLLQLPFSGPVHYFLKILLNKRYALPMKVINELVLHFKKFENDPRQMTVIWHQTFLVFAERYKKSLTKQQRDTLKKVLKKQYHHQITPLIRKELFVNVEDKITSMDIDI